MKKNLLTLIQFILLIIMIFSIIRVYNYNQNIKETNTIKEETKTTWEKMKTNNEIEVNPTEASQAFLANLKIKYPDTIAYINIDETTISYPVVQTDNNDFYLTHSPSKEHNANGSVFMSYLNKSDFSDDNTVLYGHNVKSGKLFQNLHKLKEQSFYDEVNTIELETSNGPKKYLIFSVYKTNPEYQYKTPNYSSIENKHGFIEEILNKSLINPAKLKNLEINLNDVLFDDDVKVITLSTCETGGKERLVVHGVEL